MKKDSSKNNNKKNALIFKNATSFLAFILCAFMLVSCGKTTRFSAVDPLRPDSTVSREATIEPGPLSAMEWLNSLPKKDFEGYKFFVVTAEHGTFSPVDDGLLQQAVHMRNDWVEEKYNIIFEARIIEENSYYTEVRNAQLSGSYIGDLLVAPAPQLAKLITDDLLANLTSLPYFNTNAEYIDSNLSRSATGGNTIYMLVDSVSEYIGSQWCVFYDLELLDSLGLDDPIKTVKEGNWDWNVFADMANQAALLGDGYNGFASYADTATLIKALWGSSGVKYLGETYKKELSLDLDLEKAKFNLGEINKILSLNSYNKTIKQNSLESFKAGKTLFYLYRLDTAAALAEHKREWSIVPLPKMTSEQKDYYSYIDQNVNAVAVPYRIQNSERTGIILSALTAASYEHINDATKNSYINFYLRNNASALMLNRIIDSSHLDFAFLYGSGINSISNNTYELFAEIREKNLNLTEYFQRNNVQNGISKETALYFK